MSNKRYFQKEDDEFCYPKERIIEFAKLDGLKEVTVIEAIRMKNYNVFWCEAYGVACEKSESPCGKHCDDYEPRNGKYGICKSMSKAYTHGEKVTFKIK